MLLRSSRDRVDFFGAGPDAEGNGAKRSALLDESLNVDVCMQACGADAVRSMSNKVWVCYRGFESLNPA